jgi:hypothetical protein|tara:strand:- start:103 stop:315 length:213 start_codon:yes stop_codon:yes gene_type:complete
MKEITIIILLVVLAILTGILDATLSLNDEKENWAIEDLYNPTDQWCFLDQEHPLPVDCQFQTTLLGKEIE